MLTERGVKFIDQVIIGRYIADVVLPDRLIIIEMDGNHHFTPKEQSRDASRTAYLKQHGFIVHRFANQYIDRVRLQSIIDAPVKLLTNFTDYLWEINLQRDCELIDRWVQEKKVAKRKMEQERLARVLFEQQEVERKALEEEYNSLDRGWEYSLFYDRS
jgi:hypothetical protein